METDSLFHLLAEVTVSGDDATGSTLPDTPLVQAWRDRPSQELDVGRLGHGAPRSSWWGGTRPLCPAGRTRRTRAAHPAPIEAVYPDVVNIGGSAFGHVPRVKRLPPKAAT